MEKIIQENNTTMTYFEKHKELIERSAQGLAQRTYFAPYPEHPKAYGEDAPANGQKAFNAALNNKFTSLLQTGENGWQGEEVHPTPKKRLEFNILPLQQIH